MFSPVCYPVTTLMTNNQEDKHGKPNYDRAFCIRMKSTLTKRGCHFKSSGYRVVLLLGKMRPQYSYTHTKKSSAPIMGFIGLAIALPPPSVHEVRLETDMFVTRLSFDFKIAHCEPKVCDLLDYSADDLTGKSMYSLVHAADVHKIKQTHVDLIKKGQVMSNYYRLMNRQGGYTWMQICATLVCNTKNSDEQSIICVNYVLSGSQYSSVVMASEQVDQPQMQIKSDHSDDDQGGTRNGSPESVKDGDFSNQGSSPSVEHSSSLDQGRGGLADQYQYPTDDVNLRLGKASVAASDHGLGSPPSRETDRPESRDSKTTTPPTSSPSPHHRYSTPLPPDQNSNSVRDLENAMSKHLPRDKEASAAGLGLIPASLPGGPSLEASHLLKQIYSRPGYFPDLEPGAVSAESSQFLNYARLAGTTGYPSASPAQPVPLKPNVYPPGMAGHSIEGYAGAFATATAAAGDQSNIYSHSSSSFHLYNRPGQSWYSGN